MRRGQSRTGLSLATDTVAEADQMVAGHANHAFKAPLLDFLQRTRDTP